NGDGGEARYVAAAHGLRRGHGAHRARRRGVQGVGIDAAESEEQLRVADGDRVYVHFGSDGTAAVSTAGDIIWKTKFYYESQHGNGGSPELAGDLLIL